jgi:hypothetical protein
MQILIKISQNLMLGFLDPLSPPIHTQKIVAMYNISVKLFWKRRRIQTYLNITFGYFSIPSCGGYRGCGRGIGGCSVVMCACAICHGVDGPSLVHGGGG